VGKKDRFGIIRALFGRIYMNASLVGGRTSEIIRALEADIDAGRLLPGDPLDERKLAERFEVSRTPVREAIQQLGAIGLLRVVPRQGVYVARMSLAELRAMFELLAELEGACAKLAARRIDEPWRSQAQEANSRCMMAAANSDVAGYSQANVDFHEALYEGCRNTYLADEVRAIRRRTQIYRTNAFQLPGRMQDSASEHRKILEAVLAGDPLAAQKHMVEHISVGGTGFAEFVSMLSPSMLESHDQAYPSPRRQSLGENITSKPPQVRK
jgi:DNA-binding GntR family transcriptional regulator